MIPSLPGDARGAPPRPRAPALSPMAHVHGVVEVEIASKRGAAGAAGAAAAAAASRPAPRSAARAAPRAAVLAAARARRAATRRTAL